MCTTCSVCVEIQEDKEKQTESRGARERQEGEGEITEGLTILNRVDSCHYFIHILCDAHPVWCFQSELELLMLEDGEEKESSRQHFHLPAIMKEERDSNKEKQRLHRQGRKGKRDKATGEEKEERVTAPSGPREGFQIDLTDPRFSALYESHLYAPDPANPSYK